MKMQANKLLTLYNVTLVGGVTINMSPLTEEANKDMEECIEHWKDTNTMSRIWTIP
jgi:hypothetical protein